MSPRAPRRLDGWGTYLLLAVGLAPVVVPTGPAQLAILDLFNLIALAAFGVAVLARRIRPRAPFAAAVLAIALGSVIATVNAESPAASALAIAQDAYLYLWFIALVSVMSARGDLVGLRIAWVCVACVVALYGIGAVFLHGHGSLARMLGPRGMRALGTFYDPNMFADYLVISLFMVLSLIGHVGRVLRWGAIALLLLAIAATKSNGGALSLLVGLAVWALVRARTLRLPLPAVAGAALLAVTVALCAWWASTGLGLGASELKKLQGGSFLARAAHSQEGRLHIWRQLLSTYLRSPFGIGPGNSRWITLSVEQRERPDSMFSKEAHNDYLAYVIERGPLAALALLFVLAQAFVRVAQAWRRRVRAGIGHRAASALTAALAGALASSAVHSLTIERLHFRHFWLLLAMVCAVAESVRPRAAERAARSADLEPGERLAVAHA